MLNAKTIMLMALSLALLTAYADAADVQTAAAPAVNACQPTPRQMEGPYYPPKAQIDAQTDKDNDLTVVKGQTGQATGRVVYVMGQVRDVRCRPIEGAVVEIWQASEQGRYRHPRDTQNPAPLDPQFQYWGTYTTDKEGRYLFKTIKPGAYPIGRGGVRPSHIHFKVTHRDFREFITQMYFAGDPHQDKDGILNDVPSPERARLIVPMEPPPPDYERDAKICRFEVTLP